MKITLGFMTTLWSLRRGLDEPKLRRAPTTSYSKYTGNSGQCPLVVVHCTRWGGGGSGAVSECGP